MAESRRIKQQIAQIRQQRLPPPSSPPSLLSSAATLLWTPLTLYFGLGSLVAIPLFRSLLIAPVLFSSYCLSQIAYYKSH